MAVIELDLDAPPAPPPTRPPVHLLRPLGLALTVVLLLTVGGAAPITPMLWRSLGVIPLVGEDARYELSGDHLYIVGGPSEVRQDVSAWSLDPMRRDWTFTSQPVATDDEETIYSRPNLAPADGVLLLQGESSATSILDPGTGTVLWTTPGWPFPLGAGRALVQESHFRPGTEYDLKSGDPGELFWSTSGKPHTEPPLRTALYGVDIRTGERTWSAEAPGSVFTASIDDGSGVLVVAADKLTVLDRDTGRVLRERAMPRLESDDDVAWVDVVGDLLLFRRSPDDEWGTLLAYATDTLQKRWELSDPPSRDSDSTCAGVPCLTEESGLALLDPGTGLPAWRAASNLQLIRRGDVVLETPLMSGRPIRLRDLATGAVRVDLNVWNGASATSDADQPLVVRRIDSAHESTVFGVVPRGGTRVQPLGYAGAIVIECSSNDRFVACRVPGGIEVWAYRA